MTALLSLLFLKGETSMTLKRRCKWEKAQALPTKKEFAKMKQAPEVADLTVFEKTVCSRETFPRRLSSHLILSETATLMVFWSHTVGGKTPKMRGSFLKSAVPRASEVPHLEWGRGRSFEWEKSFLIFLNRIGESWAEEDRRAWFHPNVADDCTHSTACLRGSACRQHTTPMLEAQGTLQKSRGKDCKSQRIGMSDVRLCLLYMTGKLCPWNLKTTVT